MSIVPTAALQQMNCKYDNSGTNRAQNTRGKSQNEKCDIKGIFEVSGIVTLVFQKIHDDLLKLQCAPGVQCSNSKNELGSSDSKSEGGPQTSRRNIAKCGR